MVSTAPADHISGTDSPAVGHTLGTTRGRMQCIWVSLCADLWSHLQPRCSVCSRPKSKCWLGGRQAEARCTRTVPCSSSSARGRRSRSRQASVSDLRAHHEARDLREHQQRHRQSRSEVVLRGRRHRSRLLRRSKHARQSSMSERHATGWRATAPATPQTAHGPPFLATRAVTTDPFAPPNLPASSARCRFLPASAPVCLPAELRRGKTILGARGDWGG